MPTIRPAKQPKFHSRLRNLYSTEQIAAYAKCSENYVRDVARRYNLGQKVGRAFIFTQRDLDFFEAHIKNFDREDFSRLQQTDLYAIV